MILSDVARCEGRKTPLGKPCPPCILCERRSYAPASDKTVWLEPAARFVFVTTDDKHEVQWDCINRRFSGSVEAE